MSDRLSESLADEVDGAKHKPKEATENPLTSISSNCSLRDALLCYSIEDWDEVFTAEDLTKIPVAKTNCIPIIPKKYRNLIKNATLHPIDRKKKEDSKGGNDKAFMTLNEHLKRFGLPAPEKNFSKDHGSGSISKTTQPRNLAKHCSPACEVTKEKKNKSVLWSPNLVRHIFHFDDNRTKDATIRHTPMEERKRINSSSSLAWEQSTKLHQNSKKANEGNRPTVESLLDKLTNDQVQNKLPYEKNRLTYKKSAKTKKTPKMIPKT